MQISDELSSSPASGPKLTARQAQILELIRNAICCTGAPPTQAEIATALGFRSPSAAEERLKAFVRKGAIELLSGTSRGIRPRIQNLPVNESRPVQFMPPTGQRAQLMPPLVGRVAAGSPILAGEHI